MKIPKLTKVHVLEEARRRRELRLQAQRQVAPRQRPKLTLVHDSERRWDEEKHQL